VVVHNARGKLQVRWSRALRRFYPAQNPAKASTPMLDSLDKTIFGSAHDDGEQRRHSFRLHAGRVAEHRPEPRGLHPRRGRAGQGLPGQRGGGQRHHWWGSIETPPQAITSALWVYGDGVISSTLALTHTHTYTASGVYTVSLTASGPGGSDTLTRTNYITVSSGMAYTTTHRVISYTYPSTLLRTGDSLYRLITATYSSGEYYHYTYDPVGNRQSLTTHADVVNYQYDDANRLTSVNGQTYNWDDNGNPSAGSGQAC
jgi:hypothetical protein